MENIGIYQSIIFIAQSIFISILILTLFRLRSALGIGLLYAALGLFQYMQFFMASIIYVEITEWLIVSPGSSVLFAGSLFAVLIVYIKEDAGETRKIIYALFIANIIMAALLFIFGRQISNSTTLNPYDLSIDFLYYNIRVISVGTVILLVDSLLIIILYEFFSKHTSNLLLRIYFTMFVVLSLDSLLFTILSFSKSEHFTSLLVSGIISKNASALISGFITFIYIKYIEKENGKAIQTSFKDVFHTLSYRQKFESAKQEAEKAIKISELKYKTLTKISPVGIFTTRADGYTTFVNPKWSQISGMPHDKALAYGWLDAVHPDDKVNTENGWDLATKNKKSSYAEYRFLRPDGTIRWVLGQAVPELNTDNEIIGYVGTITDITDIKNYESKLKSAIEKAEESDKLKTAFLQNMSHEIRTPMNAIIGFTDFLEENNLAPETRKNYISIIKNSTNQLLGIVTDILTISSLETNQEKLNIDKTNLNEILDELFEIYKVKNTEKKVELKYSKGLNDTEATIYTDKTKITQILTNLLNNACKFTEEGSIEYGYNLKDKQLMFYVKDTGMGVPKKHRENIFERFHQAEKSFKYKFGGTGLGLSISKGFAELFGGKIWLESETGKGTTFYFTVPYKKVEITESTKETHISEKKSVTVLVAEDLEYNYLLIKEILRPLKINLIHAKNGLEAVEISKKNKEIDLILMDIRMPVMDGFEAAKIIKNSHPNLPIVAQSAYALEHERIFYNQIFDDYVTKPISRTELIEKVKKYI